MFNVALSNIYHRFQTCTDLWSLALCRLPFHHINLSFYPIICILICFNSTNVLHVLIDKVSLFFKINKFFKKMFLNKVNIHNDGRILRRPTVLSRGWYDYQQVRQLFVSRAWLYLCPAEPRMVSPQWSCPMQCCLKLFIFTFPAVQILPPNPC